VLFEAVRDRFGSKRKSVIEENVSLIINGYEYVEKNYNDIHIEIPRIAGNHKKRLTTGNYMATLGSIKAGLKVWVHYPMTPSTPILYYMNQFKDRYGIVVMQPESEMAVIHIALGASYGGARAGVGTSGGGFALMSEAIGFAGMAEIPIVIFEVSRPGPSTGLPTRTEQGDLFEVLYPSQGVYPKCVIAPGDPEEVYRDSFIAYNIAEKYQMPVIVHYDKHLAESLYTVGIDDEIGLPIERWKLADEEGGGEIYYMRYRDEPDGVSPIRKLGDGISLWTGLEHDEHGLFSEEPHNRLKMMRKRDKKMRTLYDEMMDRKDIYKPINVYGEGDIVLIGWGSTKGVILDLVRYLNRNEGHRFKFLQIRWIQPFPKELFLDEIKDSMFKIIIENNFDGQMERLIRQETGIDIDRSIRKYDGRCFSLDGLYNEVYRVVSRWKG
jgi:2-oxoglutarate ferredoxin oxidoreductase subunit alpha